jgi:MSHA pilin protein MshA
MIINTTNTHNDKRNRGFTMIELIIVIVILGVLAVTALPKFLNLSSDAKSATLESASGAMKNALQLVYSQAVINHEEKGDGLVNINGTDVALYNGYPSVRGKDSVAKLNRQVKSWLDIDSVDSYTALKSDNTSPFFVAKSTANNQIYIFFTSDRSSMNVNFKCQILYQNPVTASPTTPTVRVQTDAC